jgi:hypothetical protein
MRIRTFGTIFRILYPYSVTSRYPPQNHPDWHDQDNDQYNYRHHFIFSLASPPKLAMTTPGSVPRPPFCSPPT